MRTLLTGIALAFGLTLAGTAQAGLLSTPGPNPNWTDNQKFEWYLGYMSKAAATCRQYDASAELAEIAGMSPYGRAGLKGSSADGFIGGVCGKIRKRAAELLEKKEIYINYMTANYDCTPGGACRDPLDPHAHQSHSCAEQVNRLLADLDIANSDVASVTYKSPPPGPSSGGTAPYQARIRLKSCQGSLYVDMSEQCSVKQSYTRGDCEVAGVSAF